MQLFYNHKVGGSIPVLLANQNRYVANILRQVPAFLVLSLLTVRVAPAQTSTHAIPVRATLSGYVREQSSGELLPGVSVYLPGLKTGTTTNKYGFYSLTLLLSDSLTVQYSFVGYATETRRESLTRNLQHNVDLTPESQILGEVVVKSRNRLASETVQMSSISVPIQQIKEIPAFMGEKDVLKVLQLMPGVQKSSEGSGGLYVRGGGPDQNLLILDDATVYNAYHLFGFFSVFNGDALKSVELTKGGFSARYGGRLSSVIDMQMKEGNREKLHVEGGIGLISTRLTVEGPLQKGRSSFLVSGRRTYVDLLTKPFLKKDKGLGAYYFYDLNAKVNYDFGQKDKLYLSGYTGHDKFNFQQKQGDNESQGAIGWGNATGTLRWNHLFNERLFGNLSLIYSNYQFLTTSQEKNPEYTFDLNYSSGIRDWGLKADFDFLPSPTHSIKFGTMLTLHRFTPSAVVLNDSQNNDFNRSVQPIDALETGLYAEDTWRPTTRLHLNAGIRMSVFATGWRSTKGKAYINPEPRLAAAYTFPNHLALKASYARMNQFVHLLSNSGAGLPTDLWVPSTENLKPQRSWQAALGLAKDFPEQNLAVTLEGYYKQMHNIVALREGAGFLLDSGIGDADKTADRDNQRHTWENNVTQGRGWSYGAEVLVQRKTGRLTGWVGYTLSWIPQQFADLNGGRTFWAKYDRRHDASVVAIYKASPRVTLSATWMYGTGNALNLPRAIYPATPNQAGGGGVARYSSGTVYEYGERNSFRARAYHRLDLGIQLHARKRRHEKWWEFSVYNTYGRKNPFFYDIKRVNGQTENRLVQYSIFGFIPSLSYNFKF